MSRGVTGPVVAVVAVGPNDVAAVAGGAPATAPVRKVAPGRAAMEAAVDTVGAEVAPNGAAARAQASRVEGVPPVVRVGRDELTELKPCRDGFPSPRGMWTPAPVGSAVSLGERV